MGRELRAYEAGVDDTSATYVTDLCIGLFSFIVAFCYVGLRCSSKGMHLSNVSTLLAGSLFFMFFGLAYVSSAVVRIEYPHNDEFPGTPKGFEANEGLKLSSLGAAGATLFMGTYTMANETGVSKKPVDVALLVLCALAGLFSLIGNMVIQVAIENKPWLAQMCIVVGIMALFMACVHRAVKGQGLAACVAGAGCFLVGAGPIFQSFFADDCAYDKPPDCPFDASFNHNAIGNLITLTGTLFLSVGLGLIGCWDPI